jgi:hypothetical protein
VAAAKIVYWCGVRHQMFEREVLIDDGLEAARRVNNVTFKTIPPTVRKPHLHMLVYRVRGESVEARGESASLPGFLFGKQHAKARRKDPTNMFDFRREAFCL